MAFSFVFSGMSGESIEAIHTSLMDVIQRNTGFITAAVELDPVEEVGVIIGKVLVNIFSSENTFTFLCFYRNRSLISEGPCKASFRLACYLHQIRCVRPIFK